MNRLSIVVDNLILVLAQYDRIKVYRATSEGGAYSEITDANTRLVLEEEKTVYEYIDDTGTSNHWYKTSYFHSTTLDESDLSSARQGGTETEKIGYTFSNYSPPSGEWGKVLTADDMRYTYMFGIDAIAQDTAESEFTDEQFDHFVLSAMGDFEKYLDIDIRKRVYKTEPDSDLIRARLWRSGVDYTDEDDPYDFSPEQWTNYGFVSLRHCPVISIERAILYSQVKTQVIDMVAQEWLRLQKKTGQVFMYPTGGQAYGPFAVGTMPWRMMGGRFPDGFQFDYTTGFASSDFVPEGLRDVIGKWATISCLATIGDGLLAGFSSQSVSLDGLSESFSSTQSATSAYFGARIKQYMDNIKDWLNHNRYKYGRGPAMSFVGV